MHGDLPAPDTSTSRRVTRNLLEFPPARCWIEQRYDVLRNRALDMASEADAETRVITWLLSVALNRSILAKLAGRLGLEFPGTRLAAVPPDVIADALIERWEEPDVRRAIITTLTRSLPDERARVAQAGTDEIALQAMAREVIQDPNARRLDGLIWALVQSPHDIARALAMVLMQSIEQSVLKHEVSSAYALVEDLESARDEVSTNLKEARQALRRMERERDRLAEANARLVRQLTDLEAKLKALADERKTIEREVRTLHRMEEDARVAVAGHAALEAELARMRRELAAAREAETALQTWLEAAEAERKGLLADLQEMSGWLHRLPGRRAGADTHVAVFMDGENLLYSARAAFGEHVHVSLSRVLSAASRERAVTQAVAYVGRLPVEGIWETPQPTLTDYRPPYRVRHQRPVKREGAAWTGNWDVGIAVDILTQAGGVDAIVLASGDGDFLPLLTYCRRHRIRTEVLAFPGSGSAALAMAADSYQELGPHVLWDASEVPGIPAR